MSNIVVEKDFIYVFPDSNNFDYYMKKMRLIDSRRWNKDIKAWTVSKSDIGLLKALFGEQNIVYNNYDDITENDLTDTSGFEGLNITPYPFQIVGANFAVKKKRALIADVMGLGKTIQALAAFTKLYNSNNAKKMLVICPASVKYQWYNEVDSKTNFKAAVFNTPSGMKGKKSEDKIKNALSQFDLIDKIDIVIVNYEFLLNEQLYNELVKYKFDVLVIDECHSIKNRTAKRSKKVYELAKNIQYVIGLSGTPLENRPDELFGVFQAIDPNLFPKFNAFAKRYIKFVRYGIIAGYRNLHELREKIQPYIIRRTLNDVALQLPEKIITTKEIEMTKEQAELHNKVLQEIFEDMEKLDEAMSKYSKNTSNNHDFDSDNIPEPIKRIRASIMGKYILLTEICDSPELLTMSDSEFVKKYKVKDITSPKLEALKEIVENIIFEGNKVVIFTQFERMVKILERELSCYSDIAVISGSVSPIDRQKQVDKFKNSSKCNIMLLTDAGNYGLNLQCANYLIMYEPPLKPSVYNQRVGRIVRIGSNHQTAFIINLVMVDGWDKNIFKILDKKLQYEKNLIDKTTEENDKFNKAINRVSDNIQNELNSVVRRIKRKQTSERSANS